MRQRILAATLLAPDRAWHLRQLARQVGATPSSLQRELAGLVATGILTRTQDGNRVAFRANEGSPLFPELQGLMRKTLGAADLLRVVLEPLEGIESAFVYGSFAKLAAVTSKSDVDLMVVGDVSAWPWRPRSRRWSGRPAGGEPGRLHSEGIGGEDREG